MKVNTCISMIKCLMEHECIERKRRETGDHKDEGKRKNQDRNLKKTSRWCKEISLAEAGSA